MTLDLIDIGANLTHETFAKDFEAVLRRAVDAGVRRMIVTGSSLIESRKAVALAQVHPEHLSSTVGIHPHHAVEHGEADIQELKMLLAAPGVCAVGEAGLDFNRNFSPRIDQERVFIAQLELAAQAQLPIFLHEREAHEVFQAIMREYRDRLPAAVVHCFTGDEQELRAYLELDLYIGITGWICDERRGHHLQELAHLIPADRIMIETDAPYLLPRDLPFKVSGRRNEPAFLPHILQAVARARRQPADELAVQTSANAQRFFGLPG